MIWLIYLQQEGDKVTTFPSFNNMNEVQQMVVICLIAKETREEYYGVLHQLLFSLDGLLERQLSFKFDSQR